MHFPDINSTIRRLREFELGLIKYFLDKGLNVPLHLAGGNESQLVDIFKEIDNTDWVFSSHRSHYHALLKGMPEEELRNLIIDGRGMTIMSERYKLYGSGIVGGQIPVALGMAKGLKLRGSNDKVWVFCGDMGSTTGAFYECVTFAQGHNLPIEFIVENNGLSIKTPTKEVWGSSRTKKVREYSYEPVFPHHGFKKEGIF